MGMARPNFIEKTFVGGSKTMKFMKVFFLESFLLYGTRYVTVFVLIECKLKKFYFSGKGRHSTTLRCIMESLRI